MAGLHSTGRLLWDRHWITTCAQADSCRETKLCLEYVPRTVIKGNGAAVSVAEAPDMVLCPAARMGPQGMWVGCRLGTGMRSGYC